MRQPSLWPSTIPAKSDSYSLAFGDIPVYHVFVDKVHSFKTTTIVKSSIICFLSLFASPLSATPTFPGKEPSFLPWPKIVEIEDGILPLKKNISIAISDPSLLTLARVFTEELQALSGPRTVIMSADKKSADLLIRLNPDLNEEEYRLETGQKTLLEGGSVPALANGTTTLLQSLIAPTPNSPGFAKVRITDSPDTAYRGLMVDVARQWHPPETLKEIIQLCRLYKIRYLQVHLTDDQSWTFPLKEFPDVPTKNRSYTLAQLKELVGYADARGVILVPEIDMPAHASAICNAMPDLFRSPNGGIINFASEEAVSAMGRILDEVCAIFQSSPYLHLGADEANLHGLDRNPEFQAAIKRHGVDGIGGLFNHFLNRMNKKVRSHGKSAIVWEGFHIGQGANQLDRDIIVMPFDNYRNAETYYGKAGHRIINTSWYPLYVVGQRPLTRFVYDWDLKSFGNFTDPFPRRVSSVRQYQFKSADNILGAQLCSWEQAADTEINQLRHPLPAMAERIWNRQYQDYQSFETRLSRTDQILSALLATNPPSPVDANASDSVHPDGVMVRWRAGTNHPSTYSVLRSVENEQASAKPIASNLTGHEYFDTSARPGIRYFYWVEATNRQGSSPPGKAAIGSAGQHTKITSAYESFAYSEGRNLEGQNGGSGWSTPWTIKDKGPATIKKEGLSYEGLPVTGGCVNVRMSMKGNEGKTLRIGRETKIPMGKPGTEFWMSFLMRANKLGEGHCFLKNTGKAWVNGLGVHTRNSGHAIKEGETVLLVAHYACLEGRDVIRMWVNPTLDQTPPVDSQDMAFCDAIDIGSNSEVLLNVQPHGDGDYDFDEIRIGRSWLEVIGRN
ncbi:MAG: family 20 glycosylhydrolase [Akkermansiaceae bacterium]